MNELTKSVEQWYRGNHDRLAEHFSRTEFQDKTDSGSSRGGVNINLWGSTPAWLQITVWNKGDITASVLKAGWKEPVWIEDRVLDAKEDIASLLDSCLERLLRLLELPSNLTRQDDQQ